MHSKAVIYNCLNWFDYNLWKSTTRVGLSLN